MFFTRLLRHLISTFSIIAMVGAGCPGASQDVGASGDAAAERLYGYPPVEGAEVTYANRAASEESTQTIRVVEVTETDGATTVRWRDVDDEEDVQSATTQADGSLHIRASDWFFTVSGTVVAEGDKVVFPPIDALEAGETVSASTFVDMASDVMDDGRMTVDYTVRGIGSETVSVLYGELVAYRVVLEGEMGGDFGSGDLRYELWFVPDFGIVKTETSLGDVSFSGELKASSVAPY